MMSNTEVEMMTPRMTLKPRSTRECCTELMRPGNPYTGELTILSTLAESTWSRLMTLAMASMEVFGFWTSLETSSRTLGRVGKSRMDSICPFALVLRSSSTAGYPFSVAATASAAALMVKYSRKWRFTWVM